MLATYMESKVYRVRANGFKQIRKQLLVKMVPLILLAAATGLFIAYKTSIAPDSSTFYLAGPLALIVISNGIYRGLKRQKELFESYVLTIEENSIRREQLNTPTIHIYKREVKEINKSKSGAISIKTADRAECIGVPAQIQDHDQLVNTLSQIVPFSANKSRWEKYTVLISIGLLLASAAVFIMKDKLIVTIAGAVVASVLAWSMYEGYTSKGIDAKTKRGMLYLVIVLVAVVYKVISVLWNSNG